MKPVLNNKRTANVTVGWQGAMADTENTYD